MSDSFLFPFTPKLFKEDGDCLSAIIHSLFEFYRLDAYEQIYKFQGWLSYSLPTNPKGLYNANDFLRINYSSYFDILEKDYCIKSFRIVFNSIGEIINMLNNNPILVEGLSYYMPWRGCKDMENRHWCLIIGFNKSIDCFLCLDPIFQSDIVTLPFSNIIWDSKALSFYYLSLENYHARSFDLSNLKNFYTSPTGEESWDSLTEMAYGIVKKTLSGTLPKDEYCDKYLFNDSTWFSLFGRSSKISLFYKYLYHTFKKECFLVFANISHTCYSLFKECSLLKLKYLKKNDQQIAISIANTLNRCAIFEKTIHNKIDEIY